MLLVIFHLGGDRYGFDAQQIEEVLPLAELKKVPRAPLGIAGILNYHGKPVPVMDVTEMASGLPSQMHMATRILLLKYPTAPGETHLLGFIAERVTETTRCESRDFQAAAITTVYAPYLGDVKLDQSGMVQLITVKELVPERIRKSLFQDFADHI